MLKSSSGLCGSWWRGSRLFSEISLDALRSDGCVVDVLLGLFTKHPEARLKLAQAVAGSFAVSLNVTTDDIKS
jgi:hypothetical protein